MSRLSDAVKSILRAATVLNRRRISLSDSDEHNDAPQPIGRVLDEYRKLVSPRPKPKS